MLLLVLGSSSKPTCVDGQFKCPNNRCIDRSAVCDFANDCGDNTDEQPTECHSYKELCNFENGTYCNWVQDKQDTFDWSLRTSVSNDSWWSRLLLSLLPISGVIFIGDLIGCFYCYFREMQILTLITR